MEQKQLIDQAENWLIQQDRKTGIEIDSGGYPVVNIIFYGEAPENVVTKEIPPGLNKPRWDFINQIWEEAEGNATAKRTY